MHHFQIYGGPLGPFPGIANFSSMQITLAPAQLYSYSRSLEGAQVYVLQVVCNTIIMC